MKLQITISVLERILQNAKEAQKNNESLASTIEIERISESDTHLGCDHVAARLKVHYMECDGEVIFNHWK